MEGMMGNRRWREIRLLLLAAVVDVTALLGSAAFTGGSAVTYAPLAIVVSLSLLVMGIQGRRWAIYLFILLSIATSISQLAMLEWRRVPVGLLEFTAAILAIAYSNAVRNSTR
jgi:hypothetical protein